MPKNFDKWEEMLSFANALHVRPAQSGRSSGRQKLASEHNSIARGFREIAKIQTEATQQANALAPTGVGFSLFIRFSVFGDSF